MPSENEKLNPQIADFVIGVRTLRKIKIYPLAAGPQIKLIEKISEATAIFQKMADDVKAVGGLIGLIVQYIPEIIDQLVDEDESPEKIMSEITFTQLEDLAYLVYAMNFESIAKNLQSLFVKISIGVDAIEKVTEKQQKAPSKGQ